MSEKTFYDENGNVIKRVFTIPVGELSREDAEKQIKDLYYASKFSVMPNDLVWNIATGERNYIEKIEHWFKMQVTGNKSKFFNLVLRNLNVPDNIKSVIETSLTSIIKKIIPSYTNLSKIIWK